MSIAAAKRPASTRTRKNAVVEQSVPARKSNLPGSSLIEFITLQWQREHSELDLSNFLLAIYFMRLGTLVEQAFDKMCQSLWGISGSDMRVLLALRRSGHPYAKRPTDLYRALLVTSGAITKKIDRLASLGMVERQPDPSHGGGFIVHLTKKGLDIVDKAIVKLAKESSIAPAIAHFSDAERAAGNEFCLRTLALMEELVLPSLEGPDDTSSKSRAKGSQRSRANHG
ncbi:MarR family winged helix-turn-helix transcriptional regulator [Paraburkholderia elongata]|uniref:MarR family transcriptional regulator n=1 Tax=Paraburkholderia elongata TaxID=2675747 RepID=A0A972SPE0_9BURK|nr:MarR family transcriptional regulator [Paraburkholderia elongata]NPT54911.1 MarR family transcriptional regulator [Paraburkholderia elongata]NPT60940.1 MarR family transcriptional regulator [Paraburkholderia elongata]